MTASQRMPPTTVVLKVVSLSGTPAAVATARPTAAKTAVKKSWVNASCLA